MGPVVKNKMLILTIKCQNEHSLTDIGKIGSNFLERNLVTYI